MKKYTLITGASSGIGLEAAKAFARRGENLILIARRAQRLESLRNEILKFAPTIDIIIKICDLSKMENVYKIYDELKIYEIKTWINNAGFGDGTLIGSQNLEKTEQMLDLNIKALTIFSTLFVRDYQSIDGTQLINVSSACGYSMVDSFGVYCATKFYVSAFTEALYRQLKSNNAKMSAKILAPATTQSEFKQVAIDADEYDYAKNYKNYHTSEQMAGFLLKLYDSDKCVGWVDRKSFDFILKDPIFDHVTKVNIS
ncbi:SDR family NAD(P)-dependent oxidoreductase [Campylobacter sp. RM16187]|uniref:SDR family NAD(P)-dependent oxidoreductase n=1 Tax=Campylobacter sp. RM16187 TaxID=1660063 RepID=UPI0021B645C6|nr:SDR family NAD(P)-dependent oxidoreductase [Campylobacter sp. RM16187]QKG30136.1 short-chain dehydrogenase/reductase [Campylobacter sp. RM16187]